MATTSSRSLGRARHITGRERDTIRDELREGYLAGASIRDLVAQTGRSFGFVHRLLREAGVILRGRGGDQTRHQRRSGLRHRDLFDWMALRRAVTGAVSLAGRCYLDHGRQTPCYLPAAFDRLIEAGLLQCTELRPGQVRVVITALGRVRFDQLSAAAQPAVAHPPGTPRQR